MQRRSPRTAGAVVRPSDGATVAGHDKHTAERKKERKGRGWVLTELQPSSGTPSQGCGTTTVVEVRVEDA